MNKRILTILLSAALLFSVSCVSVYAEETDTPAETEGVTEVITEVTTEETTEPSTEEVTEPIETEAVETEPVETSTEESTESATEEVTLPVKTPSPEKYAEFVSKVDAYANTGYTPTVSYTSDSVMAQGVYLAPYTDTLKLEVGFVITLDLPIGVAVYDDPTTPVIEGIRVNGATITDLKVPFDLDNPQSYIVEIRLVYSDGIAGTIAKISNGDFDWETILNEPLLMLQMLYYIIAALSIIVGGLGLSSSKKKKVKTADDIAALVDARVKEGCVLFSTQYADLLKTNMLPIFNTVVDTNKAVVKAITLSTSKSKEAPVALLDLFKDVSNVDVEEAIENARQEVLKNIADTDAKRAAIREVLTKIAQGTYQEVHNAEKRSQSPDSSGPERAKETSKTDEVQSIF